MSTWQAIRATKAERRVSAALAESKAQTATAEALRRQAQDSAEQGRRRQVRLNVEQGTRLMNDGDLAGSLPYFVEALRLDADDAPRAADHRLRLGMLLAQCPKPARIWFHDQPTRFACSAPTAGRSPSLCGTVRSPSALWTPANRSARLLRHADRVDWLDFSPDGRRLVTACWDEYARIWTSPAGREAVPAARAPAAGRVRAVQPRRPPFYTVGDP